MTSEAAPDGFERRLLTINAGSSSLKVALFTASRPPERVLSASVSRIGLAEGSLRVAPAAAPAAMHTLDAPDHSSALASVITALEPHGGTERLSAVGHRIVHGGPSYDRARLITPDVLAELRRLRPLDPDHLPAEIAIVEAMSSQMPELPQVACFDTAFHRTMPRVARLLALPRRFQADGVERYGFHGLSYEFLIAELARVAGKDAAQGRVVLAHLGSGASLAALRGGHCVDTTMGFTPTSGIMMGTRSGDLDPGVLLYVLRKEGASADALGELVNRRSGLLGVSESSSDMRDLLALEATDPRAADAIELFCHQARKAIGALATTTGGLDTLVFSGGIGERAAPVRARIARGLEHLGIQIDPALNDACAAVISPGGSACTVRVIRTDEESVIARETLDVLDSRGLPGDKP
jgi:acetate kinase